MNWKLIISLSLFGAAMGLASLFGYTQGIELFLWIIIAGICGMVLAKKVQGKLFLYGLFVGILDGVLNGIVQTLFFSTYIANNAESMTRFQDGTFSLSPLFTLMTGPVVGLVYGGFLGGVTVLMGKVMK